MSKREEQLATTFVQLHNAALKEYKTAFAAIGAKLWRMDSAHALGPTNARFMVENHYVAQQRIARPLTVLDSYPDVTAKQRKWLNAEVDSIYQKYKTLWSQALSEGKAKDGLGTVAALIASLLIWYQQYKADEERQRNQASGYNLMNYRPKG